MLNDSCVNLNLKFGCEICTPLVRGPDHVIGQAWGSLGCRPNRWGACLFNKRSYLYDLTPSLSPQIFTSQKTIMSEGQTTTRQRTSSGLKSWTDNAIRQLKLIIPGAAITYYLGTIEKLLVMSQTKDGWCRYELLHYFGTKIECSFQPLTPNSFDHWLDGNDSDVVPISFDNACGSSFRSEKLLWGPLATQ